VTVRFVAALVLVLLLAYPALALDRADLIGTWELSGMAAAPTLVIAEDGTGSMVDSKVKWSVAGDKLTIEVEGESHVYGVALAGDKLTLSGGDLETPTTFTRKGGPAKKGGGLGDKLKKGNAAGGTDEKKADGAKTVVGTWKAEDGSWFRIDPDGTCTIANNKVPCATTATTITITIHGQKVIWPYVLEGDVLTTTVGDRKLVWKRDAGGALPVPAPAPAPAGGLQGKWKKADGMTLEFRADGQVLVRDQPVGTYRVEGSKIKVADDAWAFKVDGDKLFITDEDDGETDTYVRVAGAPAPGPTPGPAPGPTPTPGGEIDKSECGKGGNPVGAWESPKGTLVLRADGTGTGDEGDFTWSAEGGTLKFTNKEGRWMTVPFTAKADRLILGSGPAVALTKAGIAGLWVGEEASLDPKIFLSYTQYVVLYKDGSVGYSKSEGYAQRTQVTEHLERFWSGGEKAGAVKKVGTWTQDQAGNVSIQFNGRANANRARFNAQKMTLTIEGMGVLPGNEGGALEFKRK
jgi:hypothetical protein